MSTILNANQTPVRSVDDPVLPSTPTIFSVLDPNVGPLDPNGTSTSARPMLGGGVAGDTVTVFDNGVAIGSAVLDANGSWRLTPSVDLTNGAHALTATDTNAAGAESAPSVAFDLTVAVPFPSTPVITDVVANEGPLLGTVAAGGISDRRPTGYQWHRPLRRHHQRLRWQQAARHDVDRRKR